MSSDNLPIAALQEDKMFSISPPHFCHSYFVLFFFLFPDLQVHLAYHLLLLFNNKTQKLVMNYFQINKRSNQSLKFLF